MTDWLIAAFIAAIAVSDLVLVWRRIPPYSRRLRAIGQRVSFFPYAWGVLGGHFWSPVPAVTHLWWAQLTSLLAIGAGLSIAHLALRERFPRASAVLPLLFYLPFGIVIGMLVWSQA